MKENFYPNECFVCEKTCSLRRCSRCQLISYCGEAHQKSDWDNHKEFCTVIFKIMKNEKVSHIFQNLRGCTLEKWINGRENMLKLVTCLLERELKIHEIEMLQFPRSCIVCYDTRQSNLTNCSRCPLVSFCNDHPDTSEHDKICTQIKLSYDMEMNFHKCKIEFFSSFCTMRNYLPRANSKLPNSITEFLNQYLDPRCKRNPNLRIFVSYFYSIPLTILSTLEKLNYPSLPKLTIHYSGVKESSSSSNWEILLHFLPNLINLTVVMVGLHDASRQEIPLCQQCVLKKKKLTLRSLPFLYEKYLSMDHYKTPNLIAFDDLTPVSKDDQRYHYWKTFLAVLPRLGCPLLFLVDSEKRAKDLYESCNSPFWKPLICFQGPNNYAPLYTHRDWEDWTLSKLGQFLMITRAPKSCDENEKNGSQTKKKECNAICKSSFYPNICHVCKSANASAPCKRCKMIFYCGSEHAKIDWTAHKDICKAILGLLHEKGTPHLFDNFKTTNEKAWLDAKLSCMQKIALKLQRELTDFEKQMFLFPRTCFVCHESDLSVLKICECGASLCKIHRDDSRHKNLCKEFAFELKLGVNKLPKITVAVKIPLNKKTPILPVTMDRFISLFLTLKSEPSKQFAKDYERIPVSDFLTRPLSLAYVIEELKLNVPRRMIIHVIEAIDKEVQFLKYWHILLYWLNNLQSVDIIFIGRNISQKQEITFTNALNFNGLFSVKERDFNFTTIQGTYGEFFDSGDFSKPDVIIGYNLDIPKNNLSKATSSWHKTFSVIKQLSVPFIMTAVTENRAKNAIKMLGTFFEKENKFEIFEKNPYSSLLPIRDFENEGICYSNNYLVVYRKFLDGNNVKKEILTTNGIAEKAEGKKSKIKQETADKIKGEDKKFGLKVSKESNVQGTENCSKDLTTDNEELLKENLILQNKIRMLKENRELRDENERLMKENQRIRKEIATLKPKSKQ